jgi:photosystem I subunit PsaO
VSSHPSAHQFWLYLLTWHSGLFLTMLLGQIGVQGKKTGYW